MRPSNLFLNVINHWSVILFLVRCGTTEIYTLELPILVPLLTPNKKSRGRNVFPTAKADKITEVSIRDLMSDDEGDRWALRSITFVRPMFDF